MMGLTGPRVQAQNAYCYREYGLDDEVLQQSNKVLAAALAGTALTRREIAALLARHGIVADGLRLGYILMRAELDLVICSGPMQGKQHTAYALLDERAPQTRSLPRDEALAELTFRTVKAKAMTVEVPARPAPRRPRDGRAAGPRSTATPFSWRCRESWS